MLNKFCAIFQFSQHKMLVFLVKILYENIFFVEKKDENEIRGYSNYWHAFKEKIMDIRPNNKRLKTCIERYESFILRICA